MTCNCNCNDTHRVLTVTNSGTNIVLTATDTTNIGNLERFNLVCRKPVSSLVTGAPLPVTINVNGVAIPVKNAFGLPLMSNLVPLGKTCGRFVSTTTTTEGEEQTPTTNSYVILRTPTYA